MKSPSVFFVFRKELFSFSSMFWITIIAVSYILLTLFLLNYRLILITLEGTYSFFSKTAILSSLLGGLVTAFSPQDTIILCLNAVLVGVNLLLTVKTISSLSQQGNMRLSIGGATLFGLISTGCSSCGFSILSILGLSTSLSFLPFHGLELHILAVIFLFFSAFYMLKKIRDSAYCKIA